VVVKLNSVSFQCLTLRTVSRFRALTKLGVAPGEPSVKRDIPV